MKFKPGDVIVHKNFNKVVYLVLEFDDEEEFTVINLNHFAKPRVGLKHNMLISTIEHYYTNLKNLQIKKEKLI